MMRTLSRYVCAALGLLVTAGCAAASSSGVFDLPTHDAMTAHAGGEFVAVANVSGDFTKAGLFEFGLTGTTPQTQIPNGSGTYLFAGPSGNLYTITCCGSERSQVAEYAPGATTPSRLLARTGLSTAGVADSSGNVYLIDRSKQGVLHVYAPASTTPGKTIEAGVYKPMQILRDAANDHLFVLNGGRGFVTEFAAGASSIVRKISTPGAYAIAVDSSRALLYAALDKSIEVYKQGATAPYRKIPFAKHTLSVYGLAVDSQGRLYAGSTICCGAVVLTAFAPGASAPSWRKVLPSTFTSAASCGGEPFAFDDSNDVYAIDCDGSLHYSAFVVEYSPAGTLVRKLAGQVTAAYAIATVP